MEFIWEGIQEAIRLLLSGDPEVWQITFLSIGISGIATLLSVLIGLPLGTWLALGALKGKGCFLSVINTGMALPPVVVGLWVSIFLWRSGPLGEFGIIYTPTAMIIAQTIICAPIVTGFTAAALRNLHPKLRSQLYGLGASRLQMLRLVLWEAKLPLLAAVMAGFGGGISEVGASQMVGGNLAGDTRVMTTAIWLEVSRGEFAPAIALSVILLALIFAVNLILTTVQQQERRS